MTTKVQKIKGKRECYGNDVNLDLVKVFNNESKKRIQTENVGTSIKRSCSHGVLNRHL